MLPGNPQLAATRSSDQPWLRELSLIKSSYGRLVYLAGLLNPNSGAYEHYSSEAPDEATSNSLKHWHQSVFREWIDFSLKLKMDDVQSYIRALDVDPAQLLDAWLRLTPYKNLVPAAIQGPERDKHVSDFEAILGLLRNVYGVELPE